MSTLLNDHDVDAERRAQYTRFMNVGSGKRIALAVSSEWYRTVQKHRFLKDASANTDHPSDVFVATLDDLESPHGIWVKPDEQFSDFPKGSLFVPWRVIISAVLLGPDDERKIGFSN